MTKLSEQKGKTPKAWKCICIKPVLRKASGNKCLYCDGYTKEKKKVVKTPKAVKAWAIYRKDSGDICYGLIGSTKRDAWWEFRIAQSEAECSCCHKKDFGCIRVQITPIK